jgi:hypothetical protein
MRATATPCETQLAAVGRGAEPVGALDQLEVQPVGAFLERVAQARDGGHAHRRHSKPDSAKLT